MNIRVIFVLILAVLSLAACTGEQAEIKDHFVSSAFVGVFGYRPAAITSDELVQEYYEGMELATNALTFLNNEAEARGVASSDRDLVVNFIMADGSAATMEIASNSPSQEQMKEYLGQKARWNNFSANEDGSMGASLPDRHGSPAAASAKQDALLKVESGRVIYGAINAVEELESLGKADEFKSSIADLVDFDADLFVLAADPDGIDYMSGAGNMRASRSEKVHDVQAIGFSFKLGDPVVADFNVQCKTLEAANDLKGYLESLDGDLLKIAEAFLHPMAARLVMVDKREFLSEFEHDFQLSQNENRVLIHISADRETLAGEVEGYGAAFTQKFYRQNTALKLSMLGGSIEMYRKDHPEIGAPEAQTIEALGEILKQNDYYITFDYMKDAWDNLLQYERLADGGYRLISLGADGNPGESGGQWDADIIWENGEFTTPVEDSIFQ